MSESNEIREEFERRTSLYRNLAPNLTGILEEFLSKDGIEFANVHFRIKTFEGFSEKIRRKQYSNPLQQIHDICGLRIVHMYDKDRLQILETLTSEFDVIESDDKEDDLEDDKFGYRSYHLVAMVKPEWSSAPQYRDAGGLPFEIQVRSYLMHSWANISHRLFYKKNVSPGVKRRLNRLSALMEIADSEIDSLLQTNGQVTLSADIVSLEQILNTLYPDRLQSKPAMLIKLARDMDKHRLSVDILESRLAASKEMLLKVEQEVFAANSTIEAIEQRWMQIGLAHAIMYLSCDSYWEQEKTKYPDYFTAIIEKYRNVEDKPWVQ